MNKILSFLILIIQICFSLNANSQKVDLSSYSYLRLFENEIICPESNVKFRNFAKNISEDSLKTKTVNILQIGDSHIQADMFSAKLRFLFSKSLLHIAGRGLVFPYTLAKTNNPTDYDVTYTGNWESCRSLEKDKKCNLGISGISATTFSENSSITMCYKNFDSICSNLKTIKILHEIGEKEFIPKINNQFANEFVKVSENLAYSSFNINNTDPFTITFIKTSEKQTKFTLNNFYLETENTGLVYNSVGINGADVNSYLNCNLLKSQLDFLNPELIIISLGTNDAYPEKFDANVFTQSYTTLINNLLETCPESAIILTTPGDSYRNRKYLNINYEKSREIIIKLAEKYNLGVWDFYTIMGGLNSIYLWHKSNLCFDDYLHFNKVGYELQALLFHKALLDLISKNQNK
ncbi:MAG: hypothetical protein A2033_05525 [Bacteroidetes bacterium GWA2_31_9]|nr:MAG: hypothetical protein A2033_05525 [Bacteroidetes bacterium GWA2_31_9]